MDFIRFKEINEKKPNYGELVDPTIVSVYKNSACGDDYKLYLQIKEDRIVDASFVTSGCGFSLVALSMIVDLVKNKSIAQAKQLTPQDIESLFEFPERRKTYPETAISALQKALGEIDHNQ